MNKIIDSYEKLIDKLVLWSTDPNYEDINNYYFNFKGKIYQFWLHKLEPMAISYPHRNFIVRGAQFPCIKYIARGAIMICPKEQLKKSIALYVEENNKYLFEDVGIKNYLKTWLNFAFKTI